MKGGLFRSLGLGLAIWTMSGCAKNYHVGDKVMVEWEGAVQYPANIIAVDSPGKYRVHYEGYENIWDESVPATRIKGRVHGTLKQKPPPPAKVRARMPQTPGAAVQSVYKLGDRVKVEWKGASYPATILAVLGNERYRVHYDGYDQNWDEDVDFVRIQRK
jgi:hypothetical protein